MESFLQAFLELNSEESAQTMVTYYSSVTPLIRNQPIYMQYSNHKELKTDNSPNQVVRLINSMQLCTALKFYNQLFSDSCSPTL